MLIVKYYIVFNHEKSSSPSTITHETAKMDRQGVRNVRAHRESICACRCIIIFQPHLLETICKLFSEYTRVDINDMLCSYQKTVGSS